MNINFNTFCSAPWFQIRNNNDGSYRACCSIDHSATEYQGQTEYNIRDHSVDEWVNSGYGQYLKQNLTQGNRLPECNRCWKKENNNHRSLRQIINNTITKNATDITKTWLIPYFRRKNDWYSDLLISADIKTSNLCNFACAMCNPMDSSQIYTIWKNQPDHPIVRHELENDPFYLDRAKSVFINKNNTRLLREVLNKKARYIKILGGEPLIDSDLKQMLVNVDAEIAKKINLLFVTNGSQSLVRAHEDFSHYQSVSFVVSLEGIGSLQDYIRRGSNWEDISENMDQYLEKYGNQNIHVNHTLQALSVTGLPDLMKWCSQRKISLNFEVLDTPKYLSLSAVPTKILKSVVAQMSRDPVKLTAPSHIDSPHIDFDGLLSLIDQQHFDPVLLNRLQEFINWYDSHGKWRDIIPDWKSWLNSG